MATITKSVSDAKAQFSSLVNLVANNGDRVVVKKRGIPAVVITRIGQTDAQSAAGALSRYANPELIEQEAGAFELAMEEKHAANH